MCNVLCNCRSSVTIYPVTLMLRLQHAVLQNISNAVPILQWVTEWDHHEELTGNGKSGPSPN